MIAMLEDDRDFSAIFKLTHVAVTQRPSIRKLLYDAYEAAVKLLDFEDVRHLDDTQNAQVGQMTIRNLIQAGDLLTGAVILFANEVYQDKQWIPLGLNSWDEYLDNALLEDTDRKWRHVLRNAPKLLVPLQDKAVEVTLPDGSKKVIDAPYMASKPSIIQDLIPVISKLDLEVPEEREAFDEIVSIAATRPREELRTWLADRGLRATVECEITGTVKAVQVVDHDTQEVGARYEFFFAVDSLQYKELVIRRLMGFISFREE